MKQKPAIDKDWTTAAKRVKWLLHDRWKGSRSAMAEQIKMSVTGLINVVTEVQQPGREVLTRIVENGGVDATWLLTGRGHPYTTVDLAVHQMREVVMNDSVQNVFNLETGPVMVQFPRTLSEKDVEDVKLFFDLILKGIRRRVKQSCPEENEDDRGPKEAEIKLKGKDPFFGEHF
jgi:hypothetical protein